MAEDHHIPCPCPIHEGFFLAIMDVCPIHHSHDPLVAIRVILTYDQRYSQLTPNHHIFCNLAMLVACAMHWHCLLDCSSLCEDRKMFHCEELSSNYHMKFDPVQLQGPEQRLCQCHDTDGDGQRAWWEDAEFKLTTLTAENDKVYHLGRPLIRASQASMQTPSYHTDTPILPNAHSPGKLLTTCSQRAHTSIWTLAPAMQW